VHVSKKKGFPLLFVIYLSEGAIYSHGHSCVGQLCFFQLVTEWVHHCQYFFYTLNQEGVGSITFGPHVSKSIRFYTFGILASRAIDWYIQESNPGGGGGGVVPRCGYSFLGGGLQFFSGPLLQNFKYIIGIFSSSPVDCHLFERVG